MTPAEAQNRWLSSQVEDEDKFIEVLTWKNTNNIMPSTSLIFALSALEYWPN